MAKQEDVTLNVTVKISTDDGPSIADVGEVVLSKASVKALADALRGEILVNDVSGGFTGRSHRFAEPSVPHPNSIYVHGTVPLSSGWTEHRDVPIGNDISLERARQRVAEATDAL